MVSSYVVSSYLVLFLALSLVPQTGADAGSFLRKREKLIELANARLLAESQVKQLPTDVDSAADLSTNVDGAVVGLVPGPTDEDVQFLTDQVTNAKGYVTRLEEESTLTPAMAPAECEECQKHSKKGALASLQKFKTALSNTQKWVKLETKREELLPKLVKLLKKKADKEHKKRLKAEKMFYTEAEDNYQAADGLCCGADVGTLYPSGQVSLLDTDAEFEVLKEECDSTVECKGFEVASGGSRKMMTGPKPTACATPSSSKDKCYIAKQADFLTAKEGHKTNFQNAQHAILRQRFTDRLQAIERARVAEMAVGIADARVRNKTATAAQSS